MSIITAAEINRRIEEQKSNPVPGIIKSLNTALEYAVLEQKKFVTLNFFHRAITDAHKDEVMKLLVEAGYKVVIRGTEPRFFSISVEWT